MAVDAGEFRSGQKEQWNTAAGGWDKWTEIIERGCGQVSEKMVEMAGVEQGGRVLDVACGYGEPSLTAAKKAGPEGSVVATDISSEMISRAKGRTAEVDNIEFVESDASTLDFPADSFDAAVSRWGIIFEPDGEGAAAKVREFLKPGSRFAISAWGPPDRVPMLGIPVKTVIDRLGAEPPPPGTPGPMSRPTAETIAGLLEGGGFSEIEVVEIEVPLEFDSAEDFTTFVEEIAPPVTALMAPYPEEDQKATWDAITEAVHEHADGDGKVKFSNLTRVAAGSA